MSIGDLAGSFIFCYPIAMVHNTSVSRRGFLGMLAGIAAAVTLPEMPQSPIVRPFPIRPSPIVMGGAAHEWKIGIIGYERIGFAVIDDAALIQIDFNDHATGVREAAETAIQSQLS